MKHLRWWALQKWLTAFSRYFCKKLHLRCLKRFWLGLLIHLNFIENWSSYMAVLFYWQNKNGNKILQNKMVPFFLESWRRSLAFSNSLFSSLILLPVKKDWNHWAVRLTQSAFTSLNQGLGSPFLTLTKQMPAAVKTYVENLCETFT